MPDAGPVRARSATEVVSPDPFSPVATVTDVEKPGSLGPGLLCKLVAGAGLVADSEQLPVVNAHWRYQGAKHAERVMVRVGVIP